MDILAVAAGAAGGAIALTAETEGSAGLTINLFWVLVSAFNFLILLAIVWTFAFKPLARTLDDRKAAIDKITKATQFFEQAGIVGIAVFVLISSLIIFNTIRMAIFNRRDELVIMRLLGAKPWYIRGPFVVETILYGIVAAVISLVICAALFAVASTTLQASSLGLLDIKYSGEYFKDNLALILTLQIGAGIIIGAASSVVATRRYLKLNS